MIRRSASVSVPQGGFAHIQSSLLHVVPDSDVDVPRNGRDVMPRGSARPGAGDAAGPLLAVSKRPAARLPARNLKTSDGPATTAGQEAAAALDCWQELKFQ